jgi:hypothetical protein
MSRTCISVLPGQQAAPARETFWVVSYYEVEWPKVDSLTKLFRAYTFPVVEDAKKSGGLLDYKILIHSYAGRENVVFMRKYSSFGAIHTDTSFNAAIRRITPDSTKRRVVQEAFNSIFGASLHRDEILPR